MQEILQMIVDNLMYEFLQTGLQNFRS